jgi:hypothetical protein
VTSFCTLPCRTLALSAIVLAWGSSGKLSAQPRENPATAPRPMTSAPQQTPINYPPTYSSKKSAWYDMSDTLQKISHVFTSETAPAAPTAPVNVSPAWKWYGYGEPTPGANPYAPRGFYNGVSNDWHLQSGTTPGAIPCASLGNPLINVPDEELPKPKNDKPELKDPPKKEETEFKPIDPKDPKDSKEPKDKPKEDLSDVSWQPVPPASLRFPKSGGSESFAEEKGPLASLKVPVAPEDKIESSEPVRGPEFASPPPTAPMTPAAPAATTPDHLGPNNPQTPDDIHIAPFDGLKPLSMKPLSSEMTVRARSALTEIPDPIYKALEKACGTEAKIRNVKMTGAKAMTLRLQVANQSAAWHTRDRLIRSPELNGYRISFEIESPTGK